MSELQIKHTEQGSIVVVQLAGKLDAKTAPRLNETLKGFIGTGKTKIICEMAGVTYIASAGIVTLKANLVDAKMNGGDLRLVALQKEVQDEVDVLGFSILVVITPDL